MLLLLLQMLRLSPTWAYFTMWQVMTSTSGTWWRGASQPLHQLDQLLQQCELLLHCSTAQCVYSSFKSLQLSSSLIG